MDKAYLTDHDAALPERIRGLIFDCDGTLVDTMPVHFLAWTKILEKYGMTLSEERFYQFAGMGTPEIVEILAREQGVNVSPREIAHEKEQMYIQSIPSVQKVRRVVDIAQREFGKRKLAVASGGWQNIVKQALRAVQIDQLFPVVVGADNVKRSKPAPDVFIEAARQMGMPAEECLVYEDGELGMQAARAAGMEVVDVRPWYDRR